MIGGHDTIVSAPGVEPGLLIAAALRHLKSAWPGAIVVTSEGESFVHRDATTVVRWAEEGEHGEDDMIHLVPGDRRITVVAVNARSPVAQGLVDHLTKGCPWLAFVEDAP